MKKVLFVLLISGILLAMSNCDNVSSLSDENDNNNNVTETTYITITYHSEGHTSGEPPVDPNQYKPATQNPINFQAIINDKAIVLDQGTLEKEGYVFTGWLMRNPYYKEGDPLSQKWIDYPLPSGVTSILPGLEIIISTFDIDFFANWQR